MSEKNSRRSSILKLPKARQPLQCMESGESPTENSPSKFKRRVSFAEKKHVKEFCDSIEQGTVWDNTYEESDMSGSKNTTPDVNSVTASNSEISCTNQDSKLHLENSELSTNDSVAPTSVPGSIAHEIESEAIEPTASRESAEISQIILPNDPALLANKENIPRIFEFVNDNELIVNEKNSDAAGTRLPSFSIYCDEKTDEQDESHNKTDTEDDMDDTMPINGKIASDREMSPPIAQEVVSSTNEFLLHEKSNENDDFQNLSMEITQAVDFSKSAQACNEFVGDKTQFFHDKSIELTEAVRPNRLHLGPSEKTVIFHDKSMEITGLVTHVQSRECFNQLSDEKTQIFQNQSMEFTGAIPTRNLNQFLPEKTQMFRDELMEITEPVMTNFSCSSRPRFEEKTQHFNNKSMELTEAIDSVMPDKYSEPQAQVFYDNSMEMNENSNSKSPCTPLNQSTEERTLFFHHKSMELTDAIPSKIPNYNIDEKTQFFHNKSMEITEAISSKIPNYNLEEKTQFFQNKSMDFTEIIPSTSQGHSPSAQEHQQNYFIDRNRSSAYLKRPYQVLMMPDGPCERPKAPRRQEVSSKYLEELHRILHEGIEENKLFNATKEPATDPNDSMEMTAVVPTHFHEVPEDQEEPTTPLALLNSRDRQFTRVVTPFKQPHSLPESICDDSSTVDSELNTSACVDRSENPSNCDPENSSHATCPDEVLDVQEKKATMFKDISYDFTAPIILHKDVSDLEDTAMPSFIQNVSDESSGIPIFEPSLTHNHDVSDAVAIPDLTITEDIQFRRRTYLIRQNARESVDCPEIPTISSNAARNLRLAKELSKFEAPNDIDSKIPGENIVKTHEVKEISNLSPERLTPPCEPLKYVRDCLSSSKKMIKENYSCKNQKLHAIVMRETDLLTQMIKDNNKKREAGIVAKRLRAERIAKTKVKLESGEVNDNPGDNNSPYAAMEKYLADFADTEECPWKILKLTPERICLQYEVNYMILGIIFDEADAEHGIERINRVRLVSSLNEREQPVVRMMDYLILEKINLEELKNKFYSYDHVPQLIQHVTDEINLIFDFYDELKRLSFMNKVHIEQENISFNIWTLSLNIILKIVIHMKPFTEITPSDIDVSCILGNVRINDVKNLIKNVRRDHKFLTFYVKDVKEYIEIMEETLKKVS